MGSEAQNIRELGSEKENKCKERREKNYRSKDGEQGGNIMSWGKRNVRSAQGIKSRGSEQGNFHSPYVLNLK